jgi:ATP-dependent helicase/nuclease subunit B
MVEMDGPFLDRLSAAIESGRATLEPEIVLVASNLLGRDLGRRLRERTGGFANVRFLTFIDLARILAREDLAETGRPLLGGPGKVALAREVLRRAGDRDAGHAFASIAGRRGFPPVLAALFDDLIDARIDELPGAGATGVEPRRLRALADLYRSWRALLAQKALHGAEIIARGAAHAGEFRVRLGASRLWMLGFYELTPSQAFLISGLRGADIQVIAGFPFPRGRWGRFSARLAKTLADLDAEVVGPPPDVPGQSDLARLQSVLLSEVTPAGDPPREPDGSLSLVSAPDEEREVRAAARAAIGLGHTSGKLEFERMAVVFPAGERRTYAPLIAQIFSEAGIPHRSQRLRPLAGERDGRHLRALLEVLGDPAPPRGRLLDLLEHDGLPLPVSPGRIERLSRRGGITAWAGDWEARLLRAARPPRLEDDERAADPRPDPDVQAAARSIRDLLALTAPFPARGRWSDLLDRLEAVAEKAFPAYRTHPEIAGIALDLRGLDALEGEVSLQDFRAAWEAELRRVMAGGDRPAGGVTIGDLMELRGLQFEAVFLLGAVERSFPAPPRTDPLLPDADRAALNRAGGIEGRLPLKGQRIAEEDLIFAWAAGSARRFLQVSYPRRDPATGRPRLPSAYFTACREVLSGRPVGGEEVDGPGPEVHRVGLTHGEHGLIESLTVGEMDLALSLRAAIGKISLPEVRRWFQPLVPAVERIARIEESKWEDRLGPADGIVPPEVLALLPGARITAPGGSISATRIQSYVQCPYRYFQRHVLGLDEPADPEMVFEISPLDRGTIVHRILDRAFRALKEERLLPLEPGKLTLAKAVLDRATAEEFRRAERELALGPPALWEIERDGLASTLEEFLRAEAASDGGWVPIDFEVLFGFGGGAEAVRVEIAAREAGAAPVAVALGGKIDRLDLAAGGRAVRVIDYKTGEPPREPFDGGHSLQLPIYLLAARSILAARGLKVDLEASRAAYLSLLGKRREFPGAGEAAWSEKLALALATVSRGIEAGIFYPLPGPNRQNCDRCDFKDHCDPRVESIATWKDDPRLRPLEAMAAALRNPRRGQG